MPLDSSPPTKTRGEEQDSEREQVEHREKPSRAERIQSAEPDGLGEENIGPTMSDGNAATGWLLQGV